MATKYVKKKVCYTNCVMHEVGAEETTIVNFIGKLSMTQLVREIEGMGKNIDSISDMEYKEVTYTVPLEEFIKIAEAEQEEDAEAEGEQE